MEFLYHYKVVSISKVVDGDTVYAWVDLGFYTHKHLKIRLEGIDTPELNDKDESLRKIAFDIKQYVASILASKNEMYVITKSQDKYGRWLGDIYFRGDLGEWVGLTSLIKSNYPNNV